MYLEYQRSTIRSQLMETVHRYRMVFNADPGNTHVLEHAIPTGDHRPIALPPRRIPQSWAKQVKEEVHGMLAAGVIKPGGLGTQIDHACKP